MSKFERRHFEAIADMINNLPESVNRLTVARHFAKELAKTNPAFNREKFMKRAWHDTGDWIDVARGNFIRSQACPSIIGYVLPHDLDGWNAVKLSMSKEGFEGESPIGSLFNATPRHWELFQGIDEDEFPNVIKIATYYRRKAIEKGK